MAKQVGQALAQDRGFSLPSLLEYQQRTIQPANCQQPSSSFSITRHPSRRPLTRMAPPPTRSPIPLPAIPGRRCSSLATVGCPTWAAYRWYRTTRARALPFPRGVPRAVYLSPTESVRRAGANGGSRARVHARGIWVRTRGVGTRRRQRRFFARPPLEAPPAGPSALACGCGGRNAGPAGPPARQVLEAFPR